MIPDPRLTGCECANDPWLLHLEPYVAEVSFETVLFYLTAGSTVGIAHAPGNTALKWPEVLVCYGPGGGKVTARLAPGILDIHQRQMLAALITAARQRRSEKRGI